jgi:hypothetical protein
MCTFWRVKPIDVNHVTKYTTNSIQGTRDVHYVQSIGPMDMTDANPWASEHECMSKTKFLKEYSIHVDKILRKYSLTCRTKSLLTWKNILPHVHGWLIFMGTNKLLKKSLKSFCFFCIDYDFEACENLAWIQ